MEYQSVLDHRQRNNKQERKTNRLDIYETSTEWVEIFFLVLEKKKNEHLVQSDRVR